jgi:signal transduction histidine kinase
MRRQVQLTAQLVAARAAAAQDQIAAERQQLAREFHDLVAHTLAVTMLHLSALRMSLEDHEFDEALDSLSEAQRAGRAAMSEMRQAVALLGGASTDGPRPALPQAVDLPDLVAGYAAAGLSVTLAVAGDLSAVGGGTGLAAYRIVQESLTNAAKHAPSAPAQVSVSVGDTELNLAVVNDLPGPGGEPALASSSITTGHGIAGMAQRVALLDGVFSAGPAEAGRWLVRARLPLDGP